MKANRKVPVDEILAAAKRERQAVSRARVQTGARTQESMYLILPKAAKTAKVRHRVLSFGEGGE